LLKFRLWKTEKGDVLGTGAAAIPMGVILRLEQYAGRGHLSDRRWQSGAVH
jgi:hypothetical protein